MSARRVLDILGGIMVGTGLGAIAAKYALENKLHQEYIQQVGSIRRALEAARIDAQTPVATEEELDEQLPFEIDKDPGMAMTADGQVITPSFGVVRPDDDTPVIPPPERVEQEGENPNPYWSSIHSDAPSFTRLEEEDYYDEDGRAKEQLTFIFSEGAPHFFEAGREIDDWQDRIGKSVIDDMRKAAEETGNPVLFIRNNQTDVDYEVIFEQP